MDNLVTFYDELNSIATRFHDFYRSNREATLLERGAYHKVSKLLQESIVLIRDIDHEHAYRNFITSKAKHEGMSMSAVRTAEPKSAPHDGDV